MRPPPLSRVRPGESIVHLGICGCRKKIPVVQIAIRYCNLGFRFVKVVLLSDGALGAPSNQLVRTSHRSEFSGGDSSVPALDLGLFICALLVAVYKSPLPESGVQRFDASSGTRDFRGGVSMSNTKKQRKTKDPRVQALIDRGGYTIVPHEISMKLLMSGKSGLTINEIRILCSVLRQSLGYGNYCARIATGRFAQLTGLHPRNIRTAVNALRSRRILRAYRPYSRYPRIAQEWGVNFNESDWMLGKLSGCKSTQRANRTHSKGANSSSGQEVNQRTIKDKKTLREMKKKSGPSKTHAALIEKMNSDGVKYAGL